MAFRLIADWVQMADQQSAEQGILTAQAAANSPPDAGDVCVVTTEGAAIDVPALTSASDPDGDALEIGSVSAPASGRVELDPDGTLTFVPEQPGLQRFTYQVVDDRGGSDTAQVAAFVNPTEGEPVQPVLQGLDDQQLARIAMACAGGDALEVARLEGQAITVPVPAPGERIEALAQPGQQITLRGGEFGGATYLIAEGGLLVLTDDGRMVYVAGLVDAANSEQPPTLRVAGGPAVASDTLLENLQPIAEPAQGEVVGWLPSPETGPQHWGGANFAAYDPGSIAAGPFPTGPLLPTALGLGTPPLLDNAQALFDGDGDGDGDQGAWQPGADVECDGHDRARGWAVSRSPRSSRRPGRFPHSARPCDCRTARSTASIKATSRLARVAMQRSYSAASSRPS